MEIIYRNRHNDEIKFIVDSSIVELTNYGTFARFGYNTKGTELDFVDPSGGPWIFVGMGLGVINPLMKNLKVEKIEQSDGRIFLHTTKIE